MKETEQLANANTLSPSTKGVSTGEAIEFIKARTREDAFGLDTKGN